MKFVEPYRSVLCHALIGFWSRDSEGSVLSRLRTGRPGFASRQGRILLLRKTLGPAPGLTQPPILRYKGFLFWGRCGNRVKRNAPVSVVLMLRMRGAVPPYPYTSVWRGAWLRIGDNLTFNNFLHDELFLGYFWFDFRLDFDSISDLILVWCRSVALVKYLRASLTVAIAGIGGVQRGRGSDSA